MKPCKGAAKLPSPQGGRGQVRLHRGSDLEAQILSTDDVAPRRRRDWLCEVIGREYARVDVGCAPGRPTFNEMTMFSGDQIRLSAIRSKGVVIEKPVRPAQPDSHDIYLAVVALGGDYMLEQDGRQMMLRVGDMTIYDATRPHKITCPGPFSKLLVSLPRAMLRARLPGVAQHAARRIAGHAGAGALAQAQIRAFAAQAQHLSADAFETVSQHCADLIALALAGDEAALAAPSHDATLRRVKRLIESRLSDPSLCVADIARRAGLSPRYLTTLLAAEGVSPMRYVLARRLDLCRRDLAAPALASVPIGQIAFAWGFNDLTHFSRAFRQRFGCSAREMRRNAGSFGGNEKLL